jgi:ElaB/YqjD/DUF883 family membrane-anchored ribosome-binding protein
MAISTAETHEAPHGPTVKDRIVDATRHAADLSHEARLLKSIAENVIEDGVHAAKRAMKSVQRGVETLEDFRDETAYRVKREPFKAVGLAAGVGLVLGIAAGWFAARVGQRKSTNS